MNYLYKDRKKEIYRFYENYKNLNSDSIQDANDYIVDVCLNKEDFMEDISELYIYTAMCSYMLEHDLYDEYFFKSFEELVNEVQIIEYSEELENDINELKDYINKDTSYLKYYDLISNLINSIESGKEVIINDNRIVKESDCICLYTISNERIEFDDIEDALLSLKMNKDNYKNYKIDIN